MASPIDNQQTWVPYENTKDCSQGFCSLYCPQWCYIIFPPPPPYDFPNEDSGSSFSPLVIAIICILASAFLLVSYYTIISKYCGNFDSLRRRIEGGQSEEFDENRTPPHHQAWQISTAGLDESVIKSISVCKYKKGDGLVEGTDCSVCLSEFKEEESLRLLPKCSHAFHLQCIDTWLKSHSNCPLCRANVVSAGLLPLQLPAPEPENLSHSDDGSSSSENGEDDTAIVDDDLERGQEGTNLERVSDAKSPLPSRSDVGGYEERDGIIEIRDEGIQPIRRSVSMDSSCQGRILISDLLGMSMEGDSCINDQRFHTDVGSSKQTEGEHSKGTNRNRVLHCVMSPISMKRSVSSGRFLFTRHGGRRNGVLPM